MNLFDPILQSAPFISLCEALEKRHARVALFGLQPIHDALYAAALARRQGKPIILVCETDAEAVRMSEDIAALGIVSAAYPARDFVFLDIESMSHDAELARLAVLGRVCGGEFDGGGVVCCSSEAFCQATMPRKRYETLSVQIEKGQRLEPRHLAVQLVASGYTRCDRVEGRGQFALRGGIIDVFPAHSDRPLRIELFGDDVEAISFFDSDTQRRTDKVDAAAITPAREVVIGDGDIAALETLARRCEEVGAGSTRPQKEQYEDAGAGSTRPQKEQYEDVGANCVRPQTVRPQTVRPQTVRPQIADIIARDLDLLAAGITPACTDRYLHAVYAAPETLPDYLPGAALFYCGPGALAQRHQNLLWRHTEDLASLEQQGLYLKNQGIYYQEGLFPAGHPHILAETFARAQGGALDALITVRAGLTPRWDGEFSALTEDLHGTLAIGMACVVLAGTPRAASALCGDLCQAGFTAVLLGETLPAHGTVGVLVGSLSSGFEWPDQKFCVIAGRRDKPIGKSAARKVQKAAGKALGSLEELSPGDYVVHQNHGIGVFDGIHRIDHYGLVRDYIKILYSGADTLYLPVTQLDMVSQYISPKGDGAVKLARLHSGEWNKTRQAVYRSVREMAKELIALYARREQSEGIRFSDDSDWQREFETRFAYDETEDQLKASAEIKADMERTRPMDRLLCGDVGVGKTEVALRAVFKCVTDGYQCAVLVPTTILAWQHYHTFLERLEAYPIKTAMLSRFASAKEISAALAGIKNGTVDVAIGTHRLLQKDVAFKKLGLVVVDEEQRFGVAHKERLKQIFSGVDVLTLSATPIPRTLNMAMSGIRDMSVIEEPPQDRHPVQTYVLEYDEQIILDAIKRELARGGQVYYLHNRVETIERAAARLQELLPDATVETAHGQMDEKSLSGVWQRLIAGECGILVCTTIIETGVDVPNCNTLVVENADHMGLAQLYQLRGRVGRSGRRAFAYFTFRRDRIITDIAAKRLAAIRDFTSFGSGFKIAMRDLQIRGAGSVLSARQSGHMAAVGYDTYLRILEQAIGDETGARDSEYRPPAECTIDLAVSAYIPESYIADNESRIEMYKRVAAIQDRSDAADALDELTDRFGAPPACVQSLISVSLARARAGALGFYEVSAKRGETYVTLYGDNLDPRRAEAYARRRARRVLFSPRGRQHIAAEIKPGEDPAAVALEALEAYEQEWREDE